MLLEGDCMIYFNGSKKVKTFRDSLNLNALNLSFERER